MSPLLAAGGRMLEGWRDRTIARQTLLRLALVETVVVLALLGVIQYSRPVPAPTLNLAFPSVVAVPGTASLPWPTTGQAAIAIQGMGMVAEQPAGAKPQPIASTTKMMTALIVLDGHPLGPDDRGPTVKITEAHAAAFLDAIFNDESALEVRAGADLTLRELLDGLLVASANNYARILAEWDAGSIEAFAARMNTRAAQLGMTATTFVDPSGIAAGNASTARDLLVLAQAAMANPTFAAIVAQKEITVPVAGKVATTNVLLGRAGVVGIKTGETEEAGACLVFAANLETAAGKATIYGAVLGEPERKQVFEHSEALIGATRDGVTVFDVLGGTPPVGEVTSAWGSRSNVVPAAPLTVAAWPGRDFMLTVDAAAPSMPLRAGDTVGELVVWQFGTPVARVPLVVRAAVPGPGFGWRLLRD